MKRQFYFFQSISIYLLAGAIFSQLFPQSNSVNPGYQFVGIKFFECGDQMPAEYLRVFATQFSQATTRYINLQLICQNLWFNQQYQAHKIHVKYFDPDEKLWGEYDRFFEMEPEDVYPAFALGLGFSEPGKWKIGNYRAEVTLDGVLVGKANFKISNQSEMTKNMKPSATDTETSAPPESTAPEGNYQFTRAAQGVGGTLSCEKSGTGSSENALENAFTEIKSWFDDGPYATGGFSDISLRTTQMLFQASWRGKAVVGLARAEVNPQSQETTIRFIFNQQAFLGAMLDQEGSQSNAANPVTSLQWSWQESREKASRLKLPAGWQILDSNAQGMLYARGPQGSVTFGLYFNIYTPEYMFAAIDPRIAVAAYCDPVSAFKNVLPLAYAKYLYQANGATPPQMDLQVIEAAPMNIPPPGQAALIHCDVTTIQADGIRKHNHGLSYVMTAMTGVNQWLLYYSEVCAPATTFNQNLPVLWEIWKSWKTSDTVFQKRIDDTLKSMRETNQIYQEAIGARDRVMDDAAEKWSEYIRGYRYVQDTELDRLYEVDLHLAQPLVEGLNDAEGYARYREVPLEVYRRW